MARFRGTVQSGRGVASRLGHATCGLEVVAQSFDGDVHVVLTDHEGVDHVRIAVGGHGGFGPSKTIYSGPIADLLNQSARKTMLQALVSETLIAAE